MIATSPAWGDALALIAAALDGDAAKAATAAWQGAATATDPADGTALLVAAAVAAVADCRFGVAAEIARGAVEGAGSADAASRSIATAALAMCDAMAGTDGGTALGIDLASVRRAAHVDLADAGPARHALLCYLLGEEAMARGDFGAVDEIVAAAHGPDDAIGASLRVLRIRSLLFRGRLDDVAAGCADASASDALRNHPRLAVLVDALAANVAAQRLERPRFEHEATAVLARTKRERNYLSVGACLVLAWAFQATGQLQRAAALVMEVTGGSELPRCKAWDRAFGFEVLVAAALTRGDVFAAHRHLLAAAALGDHPAAAAAVRRIRSRLARASGASADAVAHAEESIRLDERDGALLETLHGRMLRAEAVCQYQPRLAGRLLRAVADDAERHGIEAIRTAAANRWRAIPEADRDQGSVALLTARQRQISTLVVEGHSDREIAASLFLSARTVESHVASILRITGLGSRVALAAALARPSDRERALAALTAGQRAIALAAVEGASNAQIAERFGVSLKTVESHLHAIFGRLGVRSRAGLAARMAVPDGLSADPVGSAIATGRPASRGA